LTCIGKFHILRYIFYVTYTMKANPFTLSGYKSPEYFCDRHLETSRLIDAIENQRNLTLISSRRMGKTGLLMHVFHHIPDNKTMVPVYLDIMGTTDLREFIGVFSNAIIRALSKTESALKGFMKKLASLRPGLSFDPVSGEPRISLDIRNDHEAEISLELIFSMAAQNKRSIVVAIDEFQQISNYPEKNIEALLRSHIQQASNMCFIFSGSKKHMLFFNSTEIMFLKAIDREEYFSFIRDQFHASGKGIDDNALDAIDEYTSLHTFYVQFLCNRLFSSQKKVSTKEVDQTIRQIVQENEPIYASYLNLITLTQFKVLRAIAIEGKIDQPNSGSFIARHALGAASTVSQAVESLIGKEFLQDDSGILCLQDKFFAQWIRMKNA